MIITGLFDINHRDYDDIQIDVTCDLMICDNEVALIPLIKVIIMIPLTTLIAAMKMIIYTSTNLNDSGILLW